MTKFSSIAGRGDFIDGVFKPVPSPKNKIELYSPANLNDFVGAFSFSLESVAEATSAAERAFSSWSARSSQERLSHIRELGKAIGESRELLAKTLAREVAKPFWECHGEIKDALSRCDAEPEYMGWCWRESQWSENSRDFRVGHKPRGVVAVLAPFNLPIDTTLSYLLPALYLGNTVVLKSSKQTPASAQILAECFERAGFPAGVFNMIQGDKEIARRLAQHPAVDVVLFTGPAELGEQIKRDAVDPVKKTLVMELGGKNVSVVWSDANLDQARREILYAAYITAGQRSTACSRVILHRSIAENFLEKFHRDAKALVVGNPFDEQNIPFMGALIHSVSSERYLKFQGIALREGHECIMRGKALESSTPGHFVSPSIYLIKNNAEEKIRKSVFQQTEIFGPCLLAYIVEDLDEAVRVANAVDYGLTASIFSADQAIYHAFWQRLHFGNLHCNLPTTFQDIRLPFGGVKRSSNGAFTGYQLAAYLVFPVGGVLASVDEAIKVSPGMPK